MQRTLLPDYRLGNRRRGLGLIAPSLPLRAGQSHLAALPRSMTRGIPRCCEEYEGDTVNLPLLFVEGKFLNGLPLRQLAQCRNHHATRS